MQPFTDVARSIVAATGRFEANVEWLKEYLGGCADNILVRGIPYNCGQVLRLLLDRGVDGKADADDDGGLKFCSITGYAII